MKKNLIFLLAHIFAGCDVTSQIMIAWDGHSKEELIKSWGPPGIQGPDKNGGEIYVYPTEKFQSGYNENNKRVEGYTYWEYKIFYLNASGIIYSSIIRNERFPPKDFNLELYTHDKQFRK